MFIYTPSSNALVVYGHVGFDESTIAGKTTRAVGGAAFYAAMAAADQGATVSLVSILGADFPVGALKRKRLEISACSRFTGPSAVFSQTYDDRNEVIAFNGKLNVCANLSPELIPLRDTAPAAILLTTALPEQQAKALEWLQAQEYHGLIAIDTTLSYLNEFEALLKRYGHRIGFLFVNAMEFEALAQCNLSCTRTIVKRGGQGATLLENGVLSNVPAPVAERVSTLTGAGDILAGAFLAAYLNGKSSIEALVRAVGLATSYVETGIAHFYRNSMKDTS